MRVLSAIVSIALICISSTIAQASWVVKIGNTIKFMDGPGNLNGGEFKIGTNQTSSGGSDATTGGNYSTERFRTFCVQTGEYMNFTDEIKITGITQSSVGNNPAPLTARTSALYREFMTGYESNVSSNASTRDFFGYSFAQYTYNASGTGVLDPDLLQKAIWQFQGQITTETDGNNKYVKAVNTKATSLGWDTDLLAQNLSEVHKLTYGYVSILNLVYNSNNAHAQDQLYFDKPAFLSAVPEPATAGLFGLGILLAGAYRAGRNGRAKS